MYCTSFAEASSGRGGPLVARVNEIVAELHADGTIRRLSLKYFSKDCATKAAQLALNESSSGALIAQGTLASSHGDGDGTVAS
jgi:hypothetical protein